ncbi:hypothetical protein [Phocaeicola dorei]|jgi:hypothetical protein|uniref:hypothetical protein n=1 Tax=Phocaeicola dorei TaxID=357276 RepID=UPI0034A337E4
MKNRIVSVSFVSIIQFDGVGLDNDHGGAAGVSFRFRRPGEGFWTKALNGLELMGEYYDGVVNVGGNYSVWKDRINVTASLYGRAVLVGRAVFQGVFEIEKQLPT